MVMMFVGGVVLLFDGILALFPIPTGGNLRGGSFSFPPEPSCYKGLTGHAVVLIGIIVGF
jgi:hypothetical protein